MLRGVALRPRPTRYYDFHYWHNNGTRCVYRVEATTQREGEMQFYNGSAARNIERLIRVESKEKGKTA